MTPFFSVLQCLCARPLASALMRFRSAKRGLVMPSTPAASLPASPACLPLPASPCVCLCAISPAQCDLLIVAGLLNKWGELIAKKGETLTRT